MHRAHATNRLSVIGYRLSALLALTPSPSPKVRRGEERPHPRPPLPILGEGIEWAASRAHPVRTGQKQTVDQIPRSSTRSSPSRGASAGRAPQCSRARTCSPRCAGLKPRAQPNKPAEAGWFFIHRVLVGAPDARASRPALTRTRAPEGGSRRAPQREGCSRLCVGRREGQKTLPRVARDTAHHGNKPAEAGSKIRVSLVPAPSRGLSPALTQISRLKPARMFGFHLISAPLRGLISLSAGLEPRALPTRHPDITLAMRCVL
ncbi:MAG: hypothetical protein KatS3mg059_0935 [Thermomicrobiales bacterium]|nr:MAG: hypothetical protein KatS3mg059_0935 [Thermomicrobiales bacterium]